MDESINFSSENNHLHVVIISSCIRCPDNRFDYDNEAIIFSFNFGGGLLFVVILSVLQEIRHQLTSDLQNKMDTLDIDMTCLSLTIKAPQISLKTNPTRIPTG